jgi:AcrR family transcriptional regulator
MARRRDHSLVEIKAMTLAAADAIVGERGVSGLKMREIAMEIGYTVGSIYMVFTNMDDLLMQLKGQVLAEMEQQLEQATQDESDAERAIVALAKAYMQFAHSQYNRWSMIFEHRLADDQALPDWYLALIDANFNRVENLFRQLKPDCPEADIIAAASALWGGIHGVCILSLTGVMDTVGADDIEKNVVLLVESFIKGWCRPGP